MYIKISSVLVAINIGSIIGVSTFQPELDRLLVVGKNA